MKTTRGKPHKNIVQDGDPVLRCVAQPVPEKLFGSSELSRLIAEMAEALETEPDGVALAAPQVGISWQLFIVRTDRTLPLKPAAFEAAGSGEFSEKPKVLAPKIDVYINPEIIRRSRKKQESDEGCLSVRGFYGRTRRHERVTLRARREDGSRFERGAGGILAQIFEHEMDHLNGILFTDHATDVFKLKPHTNETD
ncbi:MAG: peptide deformylase [bacterium]|nr:peptide deformylase [bacterium]